MSSVIFPTNKGIAQPGEATALPSGLTGPGDRATPIVLAPPAATGAKLPSDHVFTGLVRNGYRCLVIDPPTRFVAGTKGRPQHYNRMTDADIAALPIADLLHPDGAWIFLWVTSPKLYAPPSSRTQLSPDRVAQAWGARYSGRAFVWIKTKAKVASPMIDCENDLHIGMGFTTRKNAEDLLLFRTGMPQRLARDVHEVIVSPVREHSRKPDEHSPGSSVSARDRGWSYSLARRARGGILGVIRLECSMSQSKRAQM